MPVQEIVSANLIPFIGLFVLFIFVLKNTLFDRRRTVLFSVTILLNAVLILAGAFDYAFEQSALQNIYIFRRVTTFLNYALCPVVPYLLLLIVRKKRASKLLLLPIVANAALALASVFTKVIFFVSPANSYFRGVMFFFPFLVIAFYLVLLIVSFGLSHSKSKVGERLFMLGALAILGIGLVLEIFYDYKFVVWQASGIVLILYYLFLNIQNLMLDPLTGAYNRQSYQREIDSMNHKEACFLALLDLNDFKAVNDLHGHEEGDRKLIRFVEILHKSMAGVAKVYRIGGDEFVLISKRGSSDSLLKSIEAARLQAERYRMSFAAGVIEYRPSDDIKDVLKQVDNIMYANKALEKSAAKN